MLTETISGHCPVCGNDKMIQRYGSSGHYQVDACPKCGFGYGANSYDDPCWHEDAWREYFIRIAAVNLASELTPDLEAQEVINAFDILFDQKVQELSNLPSIEIRKMVFDILEKEERCDDIETTVWEYSKEDIESYKQTNPTNFV